uniref:Uncharacterized protein n=1 Tax=Panagrolaimus superbus TaxID=310955 RepID=A0A914YTN3_9BILA
MSVLKFIICIIFSFFFILIKADDGGLSDIPFNGTPDQVQDAYRTKLAVELAEKGKIPLPSSRTLAKVGNAGIFDSPTGGTGGVAANPVFATLGGAPAAATNRLVGVRTGGTNTYSSVYNAGKR